MSGAAVEQVYGVGQDGQDDGERGLGAVEAAGEVDDQRRADGAADGSAEDGGGRVFQALGTHDFAEAFDGAVANHQRSLRRDVAGREAGAAGGDNEIGLGGVMAQGVGDEVEFVRQRLGGEVVDAGLSQERDDGRSGAVGLGSGGAAVADGEDDSSGAALKT